MAFDWVADKWCFRLLHLKDLQGIHVDLFIQLIGNRSGTGAANKVMLDAEHAAWHAGDTTSLLTALWASAILAIELETGPQPLVLSRLKSESLSVVSH